MRRQIVWFLFCSCFLLISEGVEGELPELLVTEWVVANPDPAGTFAMPVSPLRYEWRADLQARNLGEAQADIAIRGGIFENTGYRLGMAALVDPQTGHYVAELPVAAEMLSAPRIAVGMENAGRGFNASVGTVEHDWSRISDGGTVTVGIGSHGLGTASAYQGLVLTEAGGARWAADFGVAWSEGDGTLTGGDHRFQRISGRLQRSSVGTQTDIFAGYQAKYFQWPYLYALRPLHDLVGSNGLESENLQTRLFLIQHRVKLEQGEWGVALYFRGNRDDYEFDVERPGLFNPFEHETSVYGAALEGVWGEDQPWDLRMNFQVMADELASTALTFGPFLSRTMAKFSVIPGWHAETGPGTWFVSGGVAYDASNRDGSVWSPLAEIRWRRGGGGAELETALSFSQATQLAGYTAIGSNPAGGLFRGNADLRRERSRNFEWSFRWRSHSIAVQGAAFFRQDRDLVDWIFDAGITPFAARFAENVDIDTRGIEVLAEWKGERLETRVGATWLSKQEDYGRQDVDGSFYALNFPRLRATASAIWMPLPGLRVQVDQEWRRQQRNTLRNGRETAFLGQVGVDWTPQAAGGWSIGLSVENLWDVSFEQVPGVPGAGRQVVLSARVRY